MALGADSFQMICDDLIPSFRHTEEILSILGLYFVGKAALKTSIDLLLGFKTHLTSLILKRDLLASYGNWAVAVCCTDSLSQLYVEELAKRGLNIALIASDEDDVTNFAEHLNSKYHIETDVILLNFDETSKMQMKIFSHLSNKEVGVLINNIGILVDSQNNLMKIQPKRSHTERELTALSLPHVVESLLPQMLLTKKAAIVNAFSSFVSSHAKRNDADCEFHTKAFVQSYSKFLRRKYSKNGLFVQSLNLTYMEANSCLFSWFAFCGLLVPGPARFVSYALNTLGHTNDTTGYWTFDLQSWFIENFAPDWLCFFIMGQMTDFLNVKRKRA